jgi:hypothetical protein
MARGERAVLIWECYNSATLSIAGSPVAQKAAALRLLLAHFKCCETPHAEVNSVGVLGE